MLLFLHLYETDKILILKIYVNTNEHHIMYNKTLLIFEFPV